MLSVTRNANSVSELAEAVSDAPTGTEIQKLARTALETFDFSPLNCRKNYNEVYQNQEGKILSLLMMIKKFQEFEIRKKDVIRVSEELTSLFGDFLPNDFITSFNENLKYKKFY